ncbi:2664_t:CDS:2, partial [Acaulospora morrowiae]
MNWCSSQKAVCTSACQDSGSKNATTNTCNYITLDNTCICSDGKSPSIANYTLTIPYLECQYDMENCTRHCNGDSNCANGCQRQCAANVTHTGTIPTVTATGPTSPAAATTTNFDVYGAAPFLAPTINA